MFGSPQTVVRMQTHMTRLDPDLDTQVFALLRAIAAEGKTGVVLLGSEDGACMDGGCEYVPSEQDPTKTAALIQAGAQRYQVRRRG